MLEDPGLALPLLLTAALVALAIPGLHRTRRVRSVSAADARDAFRRWALAYGRNVRALGDGLVSLGARSAVGFRGGDRVSRVRVTAVGTRHQRVLVLRGEPPVLHRIDDAVREVEQLADVELGRRVSYR